jgi:hypothetical protein
MKLVLCALCCMYCVPCTVCIVCRVLYVLCAVCLVYCVQCAVCIVCSVPCVLCAVCGKYCVQCVVCIVCSVLYVFSVFYLLCHTPCFSRSMISEWFMWKKEIKNLFSLGFDLPPSRGNRPSVVIKQAALTGGDQDRTSIWILWVQAMLWTEFRTWDLLKRTHERLLLYRWHNSWTTAVFVTCCKVIYWSNANLISSWYRFIPRNTLFTRSLWLKAAGLADQHFADLTLQQSCSCSLSDVSSFDIHTASRVGWSACALDASR